VVPAPARQSGQEKGVGSWRRLAQVARLADPDPWRNRLRATLDQPRQLVAVTLINQANDSAELRRQPVASLVLLAVLLNNASEEE
jgi:hypothetical protein